MKKIMRKVLYFHYQRSERDGSFVHTREFEKAYRRLASTRDIEFGVISPPLVTPDFAPPGRWARVRAGLAKFYLRDVKAFIKQWRLSGREQAILQREKPDIVLTRFDDNTLSILWACRRERIPVVIEVNAPERDNLDRDYRQLPVFRRLFSNRHALELADGAFTVSEAISRPLRSFAAGKPVVTIPNGVDIARFDPALSPVPIRQRYGIPAERVVFGFVGSFAPWHGLDMLVDAFSVLVAEQRPVHLLLVGQANPQWQALLDRLRSPALAPFVTLAGFVLPSEIPPYLAAMDVTVLPNAAYYCSPLKLFEYMAMARPPVAADTEPVADMLTDGREGLLFPVGDVAALTECLRICVEQPDLRRALGAGARSRMVREYTWDHNAERVHALLESVFRKNAA